MKRTKLHIKRHRTKQNECSYRQSKGLRSPVCRHGYYRTRYESIEDDETKGKELEIHYQSKVIKDEEERESVGGRFKDLGEMERVQPEANEWR